MRPLTGLVRESCSSTGGGGSSCTPLALPYGELAGLMLACPLTRIVVYALTPAPPSGGMDGHPMEAYIRLNVGDSAARALSTIGLLRGIGWPCGTSASGVTAVSIVA